MASKMKVIGAILYALLCGVLANNCTLKTAEMNIIRSIADNVNGEERTLTCVGKVNINECEGSCISFVKPSANNYPSFDKECRCCRESGMSSREIVLSTCYSDNTEVPARTFTTSYVEPNGCACFDCRN